MQIARFLLMPARYELSTRFLSAAFLGSTQSIQDAVNTNRKDFFLLPGRITRTWSFMTEGDLHSSLDIPENITRIPA